VVGVGAADTGSAKDRTPDLSVIGHANSTGPWRAEHGFVAGERQEADVALFHVDGNDTRSLGSVDCEGHSLFPADGADGIQVLDNPTHIRAVIQDDKGRVAFDGPTNVFWIQISFSVRCNEGGFGPCLHPVVHGPDHRVVFQQGRYDVIANSDHAVDDQVQAHGGIQGEHHAVGIFLDSCGYEARVEEVRKKLPRPVDHLLGPQSQVAPRPPRVHTILPIEIPGGIVHHIGLREAGGGII